MQQGRELSEKTPAAIVPASYYVAPRGREHTEGLIYTPQRFASRISMKISEKMLRKL